MTHTHNAFFMGTVIQNNDKGLVLLVHKPSANGQITHLGFSQRFGFLKYNQTHDFLLFNYNLRLNKEGRICVERFCFNVVRVLTVNTNERE